MDLEDYAKLKRVHADQITRALTDSSGTARGSRSSRLPQPAGRGLVAGLALAALAVVALVIAGVISSGGLSTHNNAAVPAASSSSPSSLSTQTAASTSTTALDVRQPDSPILGPVGPAAVATPAPPTAATPVGPAAVANPAPHAPALPAAPAPRAIVVAPQPTVTPPGPATTHTIALAEQQHSGTSHPASFYTKAYQQSLAAVQGHSSTWLHESPYTQYFSAGSDHSDQFYVDLYWYAHSGFYNHGGHLHDRNPYAEVLHWQS